MIWREDLSFLTLFLEALEEDGLITYPTLSEMETHLVWLEARIAENVDQQFSFIRFRNTRKQRFTAEERRTRDRFLVDRLNNRLSVGLVPAQRGNYTLWARDGRRHRAQLGILWDDPDLIQYQNNRPAEGNVLFFDHRRFS